MVKSARPGAFACEVIAVFAALFPHIASSATFSRLAAGSTCYQFRTPDVSSKDECFNTAALMLGLGSVFKMQVDGAGFNGCVLNTVANILIYSVSPQVTPEASLALPSLEYICSGVPTTTITATSTATTVTTSTSTAVLAKLEPGSRCWDEGVPDITSKDACFSAVPYVGLSGVKMMQIDNMGFNGCVFNTVDNVLMYGVTHSLSAASSIKLPTFRYICNGIPTSTTTTTATLTTMTLTSTTFTATTFTTTTFTTTTFTTTTITTATFTTTTKFYAQVPAGSKCADHQVAAVTSKEECFGSAAAAAGLGGKSTAEINYMGFTGCVYNTAADIVMYGVTPGVTPETSILLPGFVYICNGRIAPLFP